MRFLLVCLTMALCGSSALADDDYCPLHVGDEWTYKLAHIEPAGSVIESIDHQRIRDTVEKNGRTYFVFEQWGNDPAKKQDSRYVRKDEKGVHSTGNKMKNGDENLWLSLPLNIGASWKYDVETTCKVTGLEDVTIEDKTYKNCYLILQKEEAKGFARRTWMATGIGLVKSESVFADGAKRTMTLKEFKPGK